MESLRGCNKNILCRFRLWKQTFLIPWDISPFLVGETDGSSPFVVCQQQDQLEEKSVRTYFLLHHIIGLAESLEIGNHYMKFSSEVTLSLSVTHWLTIWLKKMRMLSSVILNCQITKIVKNLGSQLESVSQMSHSDQMSRVSRIAPQGCSQKEVGK